jgi:hypothetical protein
MTRIKLLAAAAAAEAIATPALAAEYYIMQDASTKRCTIMEQKPTARTSVVVGDGRVYTSTDGSRRRHEDR